MTEHLHISSCYSDITADVETSDDWEETLADIERVSSTSQNIVSVAESQLGYTESKLNFKVGDDGVRRGYTRYGQWFGNTHGEWSTMFSCFCLRYGGAETVPISAGAEAMRVMWEEQELYYEPSFYLPIPGDIVFLDTDLDSSADATAVIVEVNDGTVTVIQGDLDDTVKKIDYSFDSAVIMGYGFASSSSSLSIVGSTLDAGINAVADGSYNIGTSVNYSTSLFNSGSSFVLYTQGTDGKYYAIDGNANAVEIFVDQNGNITTDHTNTANLFWTFEYCGSYDNRITYYIQNVGTRMYLHPFVNNSSSYGTILSGRWESALYQNGNGVRVRGARQNAYAYLQDNNYFSYTGNQYSGTTFSFGRAPSQCAVWFDGTCGGLMSLGGSPDTAYFVTSGNKVKLPSEWQSPVKYEYELRGWFDVINGEYYPPGAEITVTDNMVFYADWVASSYDIGVFNEHVFDTVSTSKFITTKVYDYNALFNANSSTVSVNVSASGHSETWQLINSGTAISGEDALGYVFVDYDAGGDITYVNNRGTANNSQDSVTAGLYNKNLVELLFATDNNIDPETGEGVLGKTYLGTGDYLFRFDNDPTSDRYGYYYYDSKYNAASYNQSDGRFYVYDYLECTIDSLRDGGNGGYSDFLPLNSPYTNTNGNKLSTYSYDGDGGEFAGKGTTHYSYDSRYNDNNSTTDKVISNYWFGMDIDINFHLPADPGTGINHDVYGNEMHFHFSGDDDVWILIDDVLVLDIGGIHDIMSGDINFTTGVITQGGRVTGNLADYGIKAGDHVLTIYYLERGSSKSNCELYFNLAPLYDFEIRKEDVLTQETLDGTEFSVFLDEECSVPAVLWNSEAEHDNGAEPTNVFTVKDGVAHMWGMTSGRIYYIKETKPPDKENYSLANGIICLTLDHRGYASYTVDIIEDHTGTVSPGYTVHGLKVDIEKQEAYIVVTNAEDWVREITSVEITKKWNDNKDHTYDLPLFYLLVKDPDGTYRRIREVSLGVDNDWKYTWTNLPKYYVDSEGNTTETIEYIVEEGHLPGYTSKVERVEKTVSGDTVWAEAYQFETGEEYVLNSQYGSISTEGSSPQLVWIDVETAKVSPGALWTANVNSDGTVTFHNRNGQYLHLSYRGNLTDCIFTTVTDTAYINMKYEQVSGQGIRIYYDFNESWNNTRYYIGNQVQQYNGIHAASQAEGTVFKPLVRKTEEIIAEDGSFIYRATNTPIDPSNLTSITVNKVWDMGVNPSQLHTTYQIPVKLYANGVYKGLTDTLTLQNGWKVAFEGLPFRDEGGNVIIYTVEEVFNESGWEIEYGNMELSPGTPGTYSTTVTNRNTAGYGYELPTTGGYGYLPWLWGGVTVMVASLIAGCILRRKRERRNKSLRC